MWFGTSSKTGTSKKDGYNRPIQFQRSEEIMYLQSDNQYKWEIADDIEDECKSWVWCIPQAEKHDIYENK